MIPRSTARGGCFDGEYSSRWRNIIRWLATLFEKAFRASIGFSASAETLDGVLLIPVKWSSFLYVYLFKEQFSDLNLKFTCVVSTWSVKILLKGLKYTNFMVRKEGQLNAVMHTTYCDVEMKTSLEQVQHIVVLIMEFPLTTNFYDFSQHKQFAVFCLRVTITSRSI